MIWRIKIKEKSGKNDKQIKSKKKKKKPKFVKINKQLSKKKHIYI